MRLISPMEMLHVSTFARNIIIRAREALISVYNIAVTILTDFFFTKNEGIQINIITPQWLQIIEFFFFEKNYN